MIRAWYERSQELEDSDYPCAVRTALATKQKKEPVTRRCDDSDEDSNAA